MKWPWPKLAMSQHSPELRTVAVPAGFRTANSKEVEIKYAFAIPDLMIQ
jgi:hypothetical protein